VLLFGLEMVGNSLMRSHVSLWDLQDTTLLLEWLTSLAILGLIRLCQFLLLGILLAAALSGTRLNREGRAAGFGILLLSAVLGCSLATGVVSLRNEAVTSIHFALAAAASVLGAWIGWCWTRGRKTRLWLIPQLVLLTAGVTGAVMWVGGLVVDQSPLPFEPAKVTSSEKRRLVDLLRRTDYQNNTRRLTLSPRDVDLLLAWGLSLGSEGRKAKVDFEADGAEVLASMALPKGHYLNIRAKGRLRICAGQRDLALVRLQVGRLCLPPSLAERLSRPVIRAICEDPEVGPMLESVQSLTIRSDAIEVVANRGEMGRHVRALLARLGPPTEVAAETRVYIEHLLSVAGELPEGDGRFEGFLRAAFDLARHRSEDGDPVLENRAAIYALGIMLGHWRVEQLVGTVTDTRLREVMGQRIGKATVRGRADWVRHFCVSAVLVPLSSKTASDAAGLLKEELDAGQGGSGFSFSDLLADRAGTVLAAAATKDERTAWTVQQLLAGEWDIDAVFPQAADLPEGLSDAELKAHYGGVGGDDYRKVIDEIERRLEGTIGKKTLSGDGEPS